MNRERRLDFRFELVFELQPIIFRSDKRILDRNELEFVIFVGVGT